MIIPELAKKEVLLFLLQGLIFRITHSQPVTHNDNTDKGTSLIFGQLKLQAGVCGEDKSNMLGSEPFMTMEKEIICHTLLAVLACY